MPADVGFATKPDLARQMIVRAQDGGAAAPWVTGGEVCGADPGVRRELEARSTGYVLAVACSHQVSTATGPQRADPIAARLPRRSWQRVSAGQGSESHRFYDWAWITINPGTGKTHLSIGLGIAAAQHGYRVLFATAIDWVARLQAAHQQGRLAAEPAKLRRYALLIDEVSYIPFEQDAATYSSSWSRPGTSTPR